MSSRGETQLSIASVNVKNIKSNFKFLEDMVSKHHFVLLQEHWLYNFEQSLLESLHPNAFYTATSVDDQDPIPPNKKPRGYGGTAIVWAYHPALKVVKVQQCHAYSVVEVIAGAMKMILVSVYMPSRGSRHCGDAYAETCALLHALIEKYTHSHAIIIGGDWNATTLRIRDNRDIVFQNFIMNSGLDIAKYSTDLMTFSHPNKRDSSQIDYFLTSLASIASKVCASVLMDPMNTSDHHAIVLTAVLAHNHDTVEVAIRKKHFAQHRKISWHCLDKAKYQSEVNRLMAVHDLSTNTDLDIFLCICRLTKVMIGAAEAVQPPKAQSHSRKFHLWSPDIKAASNTSKLAFRQWKDAGRPNDLSNPHRRAMIQSKRHLRSVQRSEFAIRRQSDLNQIMSAYQLDVNKFYRIIGRYRRSAGEATEVLHAEGAVYTGTSEVCNGWFVHYSKLATASVPERPTSYDDLVDLDYNFLYACCEQSTPELPLVTVRDIVVAAQSLNLGKAADVEGLTAEHVRYAGSHLAEALAAVINNLQMNRQIPQLLKRGLLFSVYKKKPPITKPQNHRGITVTLVLCKVVEVILRNLISPGLQLSQHHLQRGFTRGVSPLYAAFIVQELQNEAMDNHRPLYVAYLDAKAAFDTVWIKSLLRKLYADEVGRDCWLLMDSLHRDASTQIKWQGLLSDDFPVEQGVRQGGMISTLEYKRFINPLLTLIQNADLGAHIGDINLSSPTCADDVCLTANTPADLQVLLDLVGSYSQMERYSLQPTKCVVIPSGPGADHSWNWTLIGKELPSGVSTRHIGIQREVSSSDAASTVSTNITKGRRALYSLYGSGLHGKNGLNPLTCISVWKTYIIPVLTYGLEILALTQKLYDQLERFQSRTFRQLLCLPDSMPVPALYILTGLAPVQSVVHKKILMMLGRICSFPDSIEYSILRRQNAVKDSSSHSWVTYVKVILALYELPSVSDLLELPPGKSKWKTIVRTAVHRHWEEKIARSCQLYTSLKYLNYDDFRIDHPHLAISSVSPSVMDVRRAPTKYRLMTGTYSLQSNRCAQNQFFSPVCRLCGIEAETRQHFITACSAIKSTRSESFETLSTVLTSLNLNIDLLSSEDLTTLLINCKLFVLRGSITHSEDLKELESVTRRVLYSLHSARRQIINVRG